jgi:phosphoglycerate-specific signal transduction histidine kinase
LRLIVQSEGNVCFYCINKTPGGVWVCHGCRGKVEIDKRDLDRYRRMATRERSLFFRLSKENQKLREYVAKLEAEVKRRKK